MRGHMRASRQPPAIPGKISGVTSRQELARAGKGQFPKGLGKLQSRISHAEIEGARDRRDRSWRLFGMARDNLSSNALAVTAPRVRDNIVTRLETETVPARSFSWRTSASDHASMRCGGKGGASAVSGNSPQRRSVAAPMTLFPARGTSHKRSALGRIHAALAR
jgi:hypothetical protein